MDIPCLIFVQSMQRVEELYSEIKNFGIPVAQIRSVSIKIRILLEIKDIFNPFRT